MMTQGFDTKPVFDYDAVFDVDDYLYFYGDMLTDERTEAEVTALVQILELTVPMTILDLACGFGRHANRLAALGHQVTGIDLMPGFLEIGRRNAAEKGVQVIYQQGDMRQLSFIEMFDRVMMLFTAFGYFEDEDNLLVLKNVARALKPGGSLVFDIPNRDVILNGFLPYIVTEKDQNLMIDRNTFDSATGRLYNRRIIIRDDVRKDKPFFVRIYNPTEISDVLDRAGLGVYKMYGGWDGQQISTDSRRMVVVARKL
jgi:SAM-dependent methyltransferase